MKATELVKGAMVEPHRTWVSEPSTFACGLTTPNSLALPILSFIGALCIGLEPIAVELSERG